MNSRFVSELLSRSQSLLVQVLTVPFDFQFVTPKLRKISNALKCVLKADILASGHTFLFHNLLGFKIHSLTTFPYHICELRKRREMQSIGKVRGRERDGVSRFALNVTDFAGVGGVLSLFFLRMAYMRCLSLFAPYVRSQV